MPFSLCRIGDHSPFECFVYAPEDRGTNPPIVVFLHGSGERGIDPALMLQNGLDAAIESLQPPAIVLFPQCTDDHRLFYGAMEQRVLAAISHAHTELGGDATRVSLMGYSMGATSTLFLAARHPHKFAALVPIAVGITYPDKNWPQNLPQDPANKQLFNDMFVSDSRVQCIAQHVKDLPVWFIHGEKDKACPTVEARLLADELEKLGKKPKFTEYPDVGHDSLLQAINEPGLFDWLLAQPISAV